jgi:hypothetical protein
MVARSHQKVLAEHKLAIGRFLFYEGIVVGEIKEGVHVTIDNATLPFQLAKEQYGKETPVVYISHRLNSYSIDPVGYYRALNKQFPNLIAFAIVSQHRSRRMLAKFEKLFIKKPVEVFNTLEAAFCWAEEQLLKNTGHIKVMGANSSV